jgi:Tfp pilus assembly protein PilZ
MDNNSKKYLNHSRRSYDRYPLDTIATLIDQGKGHKSLIVKNVCGGGVCITLKQQLIIGDMVTIELILPTSSQAITRSAKVIWCEKLDENLWQAGLDFGVHTIKIK